MATAPAGRYVRGPLPRPTMRAPRLLALAALLVPAASAQKGPALGGAYAVRGTNPDGRGGYRGTLQVTPTGDTYGFAWATGTTAEGVGVRRGDAVAVAYGGADCGVALYAPGANGTLVGTWAGMGGRTTGTEILAPADGGGFTAMGMNPGGAGVYRGTALLRATGATFAAHWEVGGSTYDGTGVRLGDAYGVAYGDASCGVALYRLNPDGSLEGAWALQGQTEAGTETATRR